MFKIILFFLGIFLTSFGIFFTLIYTNLLTMGYSFGEFVKFIISTTEFYLIFLGLICLFISLERRKKK